MLIHVMNGPRLRGAETFAVQLAEELAQDVRHGIRLIVRNSWFSIAAILTLAVAIGGNTAIFVTAKKLVPPAVAEGFDEVRVIGAFQA